jgi:hypothetical protein
MTALIRPARRHWAAKSTIPVQRLEIARGMVPTDGGFATPWVWRQPTTWCPTAAGNRSSRRIGAACVLQGHPIFFAGVVPSKLATISRSSSFSAVLGRMVSGKSFGAIADSCSELPFRPARRPAMISRCQFITFIACEASSSAVRDGPLAAGADILGLLPAIGSRVDGSPGGSRSGPAGRGREAVLPDNHALSSMIRSRCSSTSSALP